MRFYICADIEGVSGVSSREQLRPEGGAAYVRAAQLMTQEIAAVARGLVEGGATEIVVSDSHGGAQNLDHEILPREVTLIRAWPRPLDMMEGIQEGSYAGALFIGHHTGGSSIDGVLAHTYSSRWFVELRANGVAVSETMMNAGIAAHFGVPILMASGDSAYCAHVRDVLPGTVVVETKRAIATLSAAMRHPVAVREALFTRAREVAGTAAAAPRPSPPGALTLELTFASRLQAEVLSYLDTVERTGANSVRHRAADPVAAARFLHFVQAYPQTFS